MSKNHVCFFKTNVASMVEKNSFQYFSIMRQSSIRKRPVIPQGREKVFVMIALGFGQIDKKKLEKPFETKKVDFL